MRIYQNYNTGDDGDYDIYGVNWGSQTFTPVLVHMISKLKLKLFRVGDPGTVNISIKLASGGKPIGGDLCVGTIEGTDLTLSANGEWYEITLGDGYTFAADTQYAIVVKAVGGDSGNKVSWRADTSSPTYAGGTVCTSSDSGIDWGTISAADFMFEEWGTGEASPGTTVWGNLFKSAISSEKIEEAILRMIQDHENDENAHVEAGESLNSHKASEIIDHIAQSIIADKIGTGEIWESHRHSISAWKRLLAMFPSLALETNKLVYTGVAFESWLYGLAFTNEYVYALMGTTTPKILKIRISDMTKVDEISLTGAAGYGSAIVSDGTYIYASTGGQPGKVFKIDPSDMTLIDTWVGTAGQDFASCLTLDGTNVYVGLGMEPAGAPGVTIRVIKIDPSNMTTVDTFTGDAGDEDCNDLIFDGINIYVTGKTDPGMIIKIDTSDMSRVSAWTGAAGENDAWSLAFDGTYIYVGLGTIPGRVIKVNPTTMATVASFTGGAESDQFYGLTFDGKYIYAGSMSDPGVVHKLDPSDMSRISTWTGGAGEDRFNALASDGNYIFFGGNTAVAVVIRKIMSDLDETAI